MGLKTYTVKEIFYSLQGEGSRAGSANVFLRFAGCNLDCKKATHGFDCDTDWAHGDKMTLPALVAAVRAAGPADWIICTGGEPLLQLDQALIDALHTVDFRIAIETNGTQKIPAGIDFVAMSPKVPESQVIPRTVDELRYVRGVGQSIPHPSAVAKYHYLSPAHDGQDIDHAALDHCIELCKANPLWRLSQQQHKAWSIR